MYVCAASDGGVPCTCLTQCSNPSIEAAVLIKLIVKIFWSCTFHNIPAMMQDRAVRGSMCGLLLQPSHHHAHVLLGAAAVGLPVSQTAIAWFRLLNSLLSKPFGEPGSGTQPEQPADADDRAAWPWWKVRLRSRRCLPCSGIG